jgi:hypothetical protein
MGALMDTPKTPNLQEGADAGMRMSDVDGYTIVERTARRPKIHLLRPWNECNTERGKSGSDTIRVKGSREALMTKLFEMGYRNGGEECRRCFRYSADDDIETPVVEMGDPELVDVLDKYSDRIRAVAPPSG